MKIEKINDDQIKFILTETDLRKRNIKINELAYGSEKTQELFQEIMEQATIEYNFKVDNIPLMIEAVPVASDGLMIIITKISNKINFEDKLNLILDTKEKIKPEKKKISKKKSKNSNMIIYSFKNLNDVIYLSNQINEYDNLSSMYKYNNVYFLVLYDLKDNDYVEKLNIILSEYGTKHISNYISKQHLIEHGECIIEKNAINLLSKI